MNKTSKGHTGAVAKPGPLDRSTVESWAIQHRIEAPTAEKVMWLTRLLRGVMQSNLGRDFALMGGSAIVFLYRDMYRISTDLDLDFVGDRQLGKRGQQEVDARIERDRKQLAEIASGLGMGLETRGKRQARFVQY